MGEAIIDVVSDGITQRRHPGGSPANVAVGLSRLGSDVSLLTELGDDSPGAEIRDHLAAEGVHVITDPEPSKASTASATAVLDDQGAATYVFDLQWSLREQTLYHRFGLLHTGSIAAFLDPGARTVHDLFRQSRSLALLSFDPNIRPGLMPDKDECLERFESMVDIVDIVKMSDEDAAWLYPGRSPEEVAETLVERGPGLVIITQGAHGALLWTDFHRCSVPARPTPVVDTIGAGDSYMASVLHSVAALGKLPATVQELQAIGSTASLAASITVSRAGAQPPNTEELAQLKK
ncbi:carbohydrate kinase family protein [Arthrobacter burdickii]|uniref:Carbohydrate kinase n=1 Tax=Arthrobacter burdickii TaxID=3035920 RepID=A0ABT8JXJ6_9MICC|nr:carbohydrate kinase [Arthrobacter burdickii]MDN4609894.1 carbohydrate kinase [Arthrobacter burdickii]